MAWIKKLESLKIIFIIGFFTLIAFTTIIIVYYFYVIDKNNWELSINNLEPFDNEGDSFCSNV